MNTKHKIIIIAGPTATGKTEYGIDLALLFNGEIVNCDSRQVYKYMNIGTAKPNSEQMSAVRHYMIDVVEPSVHFSAAKYIDAADNCIGGICNNGSVPFIVGGTGLYIKALLHGLALIPHIDETVRKDIREQQKIYGNKALYDKLVQIDFEDAVHIKQNDTYRLIRALEVFVSTGKPLHRYLEEHGFSQTRYDYLYIVLYRSDKQKYYASIEKRVDDMINNGLTDEVRWLLNNGYDAALPVMKTFGYAEISDYLNGRINLNTAAELIKKRTKAYAKRQITWFKSVKDAVWIDVVSEKNKLNDILKRTIDA